MQNLDPQEQQAAPQPAGLAAAAALGLDGIQVAVPDVEMQDAVEEQAPGNLADVPSAAPIDVDVQEHGTITDVDVTALAGAVVGRIFSSRIRRGAPARQHTIFGVVRGRGIIVTQPDGVRALWSDSDVRAALPNRATRDNFDLELEALSLRAKLRAQARVAPPDNDNDMTCSHNGIHAQWNARTMECTHNHIHIA